MSAGTPGIAATQKGKIQWWGAAYENIKAVRRSTEEYRLPGMFPVANYKRLAGNRAFHRAVGG
jgi:hypothetical protein